MKLTNGGGKGDDNRGRVALNTLHMYETRLHVVRLATEKEQRFPMDFPSTRFVAVTAYQNEEVTAFKIR